MRTDKHVRMVIRPDGSCWIDAVNFQDATCTQATQQILQALAGDPLQERLKLEAQRLPLQTEQRKETAR